MAKKDKWHSAYVNNETYMMYYNRLRDYALSMFKWEGLPDSINERFLNITLYEDGKILFFKDDSLGFLALPCTVGGQLNVYNEPTKYTPTSVGFYSGREYDIDEAVVIWNNLSRTPIDPIVRQYAYRLYEVERTIDVNLRAQKTPVLILADESQRLTLKNVYQQYDGNEPVIYGNKSGFDKESVTVLKTDAPYLADKMMAYKHNLWNEAMTMLGIGNAKQDKKERLVADEVKANDEQIEGSRFIWLEARQQACEQINKMFGLNVSVDFKLNEKKEQLEENDHDRDPTS